MSRSPHRSRRVRVLLVAACAVLAAAGTLGLVEPAAGAVTANPVSASGAIRYARIDPLCAAPTAGHESCMGLRRVAATKSTPGAVAYHTQVGATGPSGGFSPANLATAYSLDTKARTKMTVAVIDAYHNPRVRQELNHFDHHYGLPSETSTSLRVVNQAGGTKPPKVDWGWAAETALDVQAVRGLCNKCKILLVEADGASTTSLADAVRTSVRLGADIVSVSYGAPEAGFTAPVESAYRQPGVVVVAASGDDGWYDWDQVNTVDSGGDVGGSDNMPNAPASLPSVVAVGGTTLLLDPDGSRDIEVVWNGNGLTNSGTYIGATGGGCSLRFTAPAWQKSVAGWSRTGCGSKRLVADVSAVADPATGYSVWGPDPKNSAVDSWQVVGGTSLAAPLVAAMYGLAGGSGGVAYPAESLYVNYRQHPSWANDIRYGGSGFCGGATTSLCSLVVGESALFQTGNPNNLADGDGDWLGLLDCGYSFTGSESVTAHDTQCNAAAGYDGPSGVGTVNGVRLLRAAPSLVR